MLFSPSLPVRVLAAALPSTGAQAIAGEWGHNPLPWADDDERTWPQCYCGKRACIETFLSGPAMTTDHQRASGVRLLPRHRRAGRKG